MLQVLKQIVDNFDEGKVIPKCQFSAKAVIPDGEVVPPLLHQATLLGAKPPDNIITFDITPPPIVGMYTFLLISGILIMIYIFFSQSQTVPLERDQHLNQVDKITAS